MLTTCFIKRHRTCPHTISHKMLKEEKYTLFEVWKRCKLSLFLITGLKYTDDTMLVNRRLQMQNVLSYLILLLYNRQKVLILTHNTYHFFIFQLRKSNFSFLFCTSYDILTLLTLILQMVLNQKLQDCTSNICLNADAVILL